MGKKAQHAHSRNRELFAKEHFGNAQEALGTLEHGMHTFLVTRGQFGMIDVILAVLDQVGPSHASLWTWSIAEYETKMVERLIMDGRLLSAQLFCEYGSITKNGATVQHWVDRFGAGSVKFIVSHAKIFRIWNDDWKICGRGSCNLNYNPRFEQLDIDDHSEAFDLVERIEGEIPRCDGSSGRACYLASSLGKAFEGQNRSRLFGQTALWDQGIDGEQLKTWKP